MNLALLDWQLPMKCHCMSGHFATISGCTHFSHSSCRYSRNVEDNGRCMYIVYVTGIKIREAAMPLRREGKGRDIKEKKNFFFFAAYLITYYLIVIKISRILTTL